jgi:hypothetical protein
MHMWPAPADTGPTAPPPSVEGIVRSGEGNHVTLAREVSSETTFPVALRGYDRAAVEIRLAKLSTERLSFDQHALALEEELAGLAADRPPNHGDAGRTVHTVMQAAYDERNRTLQEAELAARQAKEQAAAMAEAARQDATAAGLRAEAAAREDRDRLLAQSQERAQGVLADAQAAIARMHDDAQKLVEEATAQAARAAVDEGHRTAAEQTVHEQRIEAAQRHAEEALQKTDRESRAKQEGNLRIIRGAEQEAKGIRETAAKTAEDLTQRAEAVAGAARHESETAIAAVAAEVRELADQLNEIHRSLTGRSAAGRRLAPSR